MDTFLNSLNQYLGTGSLLAYAAAFAGGLLTSFTPCVYPLIPVTAGYIGGREVGSRARGLSLSLSYVLGMATVYSALGTAAALSGKVFGEAASSPISYLVVGNLCLLFGLSMLDLFTIPLPSFLARAPAKGGSSGMAGAYLVGAASGLIVGPCATPVLGSLLVFVGSRHNVFFGASLLFVFALGMGAVLLVVGTFSGLLASLPKSGKWLVNVKRALGALLILAAQYFFVQAGKLLT